MRNTQHGVLVNDRAKAYKGYTLFAPLGCPDTWLIDMEGKAVHHWRMPERPGCYSRLLPSGNLLAGCRTDMAKRIEAGAPLLSGFGGLIQELDWDGNVLWEHEDMFLHHDFCKMENGNVMVLKYIEIPKELAAKVKGGIAGTEDNGKMWGDVIQEITPDGKVVWEWVAHEYLDPDRDKICPLCHRKEWTHANTCLVLENGDVFTCFRQTNMICIIDKKTKEIKWEWGTGMGELAHPHDPHPLANGNILIFDNGYHRGGVEINASFVYEVDPKEKKIVWQYQADPMTDFYSGGCGSAQRLANGNTLICSTLEARIFEVTDKGQIVWEYVNPFYGKIEFGTINWMFRAYRYGPDFSGLAGKDLSPKQLGSWNGLYTS